MSENSWNQCPDSSEYTSKRSMHLNGSINHYFSDLILSHSLRLCVFARDFKIVSITQSKSLFVIAVPEGKHIHSSTHPLFVSLLHQLPAPDIAVFFHPHIHSSTHPLFVSRLHQQHNSNIIRLSQILLPPSSAPLRETPAFNPVKAS